MTNTDTSGSNQFLTRSIFRALSWLARNNIGRHVVESLEVRILSSMMGKTSHPGREGKALGYLFEQHEPGRSARKIYHDVFSPERYKQGYKSQLAQDLFLNHWFFKNGGPGYFVDVGAFDGELGSNTWFFEKHLGWTGIAFEPNEPAFHALQQSRSCDVIQGCAYNRNGEVEFLALTEEERPGRSAEVLQPANFLALLLDPDQGGVMLSGIYKHIENMARVDKIGKVWNIDKKLEKIPCYRIDSVLASAGVATVDFLSIDVEGAELEVLQGIDFSEIQVNVICVERSPRFVEVYELLTSAGFEYHGLLFFDEVFVHSDCCFSWEQNPPSAET